MHLKTVYFRGMPPALDWTKGHYFKFWISQYCPVALGGTRFRSRPLGSTVAPDAYLKIAFRELVAFSTATNFKRRRIVNGGSPLRILATVPLNP